MAEKFPTPQERAMAWLLEATEIGGMSRPETALYAYQAGMLNPIPQQTLDDADALARIFKCKNYRNNETEMWE